VKDSTKSLGERREVDHGVCLRCETLTLIKVAAALHWERELLNLIGFRCGRLQIPREAPFPNEVLLRLFKGVHCTLVSRVHPSSIYRGEWAVYTLLLLVGVFGNGALEREGQAHLETLDVWSSLSERNHASSPRIPHIAWSFRLF
jgi:hypothetical protein